MVGNGTAYASHQERLTARLAEPRTAEALERLLDKLDVVAFGVEAIDGFLRRSEDVADSLAASIEDLKLVSGTGNTASDFVSSLPQLARAGTQVAAATQKQGFQNLMESGLIDKLGDPRTIANIETVLSNLELAAFAMTAIDGFVKRGDEITDNLSEALGDARKVASSIDLEKLKVLPKLLDAVPPLLESGILEQIPQLANTASTLMNSGLLRPDLLANLAEAGHMLNDSYNEAKQAPARKLGIFGLLKELRDPDVNRSVTLLLEVAKRFGQKIKD